MPKKSRKNEQQPHVNKYAASKDAIELRKTLNEAAKAVGISSKAAEQFAKGVSGGEKISPSQESDFISELGGGLKLEKIRENARKFLM